MKAKVLIIAIAIFFVAIAVTYFCVDTMAVEDKKEETVEVENAENTELEENEEVVINEEETEDVENGETIIEDTEEDIETPVEENKVSAKDQFNEWAMSYAQIILTALSSTSGVAVLYYVIKKILKKLTKSVEESNVASEADKKEALKKLEIAERALDVAESKLAEANENFEVKIAEMEKLFEDTKEKYGEDVKKLLDKCDIQQKAITDICACMTIILAKSPSLVSEGDATTLLKLLEGVGNIEN